jgi:tetratricopeptide (TPR) repeat protein
MSGNHLVRLAPAAILTVIICGAVWWYGWPAYQLRSAQGDLAAGNVGRAEKTLDDLLHTVPNQAEAQFLHAQALRRLKRYGDAQSALGKVHALGLPSTDSTRREEALVKSGIDFRRGEEALRKIFEEAPSDIEVIEMLADGYSNLGRWPHAERIYDRWLELQPDNLEALFGRGRARAGYEQNAGAIVDLQAVLDRAPEHFHARLQLGNCYLNEARMREAQAELAICRELRPDRPEPLIGLAACATDRGDLDTAQKLLNEAKQLDPDSVLLLHDLGDHYLFRGRYDLAEGLFAKLARLDTHDKQAFLKLAQALRKNGKEELARKSEARYRELDAEELRRANSSRDPR